MGRGDKERIYAIDREYLRVGSCGGEGQKAYVCARARRRWQNPCVEKERKRGGNRKREREGKAEYIRTYVAGNEENRAEGERTRRMQGSSVRGSVVAMGIGGEGYSGTREERVGRCKRTIKFYGSPELYLSSARPRLSSLSRRFSRRRRKLSAGGPDNILLFCPFK